MYQNAIPLLTTLFLLNACTTLDESFQLGGTLGAASGASATYAATHATGTSPDAQDLAIGAGVGFGIGLILSYFIHDSVTKDRADAVTETELYFGDLPPSPFVIPQKKFKKGDFR